MGKEYFFLHSLSHVSCKSSEGKYMTESALHFLSSAVDRKILWRSLGRFHGHDISPELKTLKKKNFRLLEIRKK
jgi:hypothetical protein